VNGPVQVFTAIALISLPTVMFGGFSLLRLLVARRLNEFQVAYFRAGHAHAGVLLVLTLAVLDLLTHTSLSRTGQWIVGTLLLAGSWRSPAACSFTWALASQGNGRPETR